MRWDDAQLSKFRAYAADCALIGELAVNPDTRKHFRKLSFYLGILVYALERSAARHGTGDPNGHEIEVEKLRI